MPVENLSFDSIPIIEGAATVIGVTYSLVSPVSLNQGAAGKSIYLYMTRDQIEATFEKEPATGAFSGLKNLLSGKSTYTDSLSPITDICLCSGDAVPEATVIEAEPAGDGAKSGSAGTGGSAGNEAKAGSTGGAATAGNTGQSKTLKWEAVLDEDGNKANVNEGVIAIGGNYIQDCRLYLFVQRYNGKAKPGAEAGTGTAGGAVERGNLYMS